MVGSYAQQPERQVVHQEIVIAQADSTITLTIDQLYTDCAVTINPDQR